jgi:hypothetical protein
MLFGLLFGIGSTCRSHPRLEFVVGYRLNGDVLDLSVTGRHVGRVKYASISRLSDGRAVSA